MGLLSFSRRSNWQSGLGATWPEPLARQVLPAENRRPWHDVGTAFKKKNKNKKGGDEDEEGRQLERQRQKKSCQLLPPLFFLFVLNSKRLFHALQREKTTMMGFVL